MKKKMSAHRIAYIAILAALVYVVIWISRFPIFSSKLNLSNVICLLSALLMGPFAGGLAAGMGSAIFDLTLGGYGAIEALVTFVSKFAMAWVCGIIAFSAGKKADHHGWNIAGCVAGAWTYVALYMLKTYVKNRFIFPVPLDKVWVALAGKFPASAINAVAAMIVAPILYTALRPALQKAGLLDKIRS